MSQNPVQVNPFRSERTFLHDISSPLSALQLNLDVLLEACGAENLLRPELHSVLKDAYASAEKMTRLVRERREELVTAGVAIEKK
jgi:hypothetical protein